MNHLNFEVAQHENRNRLADAEHHRKQRGIAPERRWVHRQHPYR